MKNAKCSICGQDYEICNSCLEQKTFKPWRTVTDTIEHYKIYMAIHGYTLSKDKGTAKEELKKCDLSGLKNFNPEIKAIIGEIMADSRKNKTVTPKDKNKTDSTPVENSDINE